MADYDEFISTRESAVRYLRKSHVLLFVLTLLISSGVSLYIFEPVINQSGQLVFKAWYPFSTEDTVIFTLVFIYQIFNTCLAGLFILVANLVFCELGLHLTEHLQQLCLSIQEAVDQDNYQSTDDMENEMNIRLAWCVKRHITLIKRIELVRSSLETAACVDYSFCIVTAAIVAMQTIIMYESVSLLEQAKSVGHLICALIEMFPPCLFAQQNIEAQLKVAETAFSHKIVTVPESVRRTLNIMYIRSQVVTQIMVVFGLIDINLVTYSDSVSSAYGIFTILRQFKG